MNATPPPPAPPDITAADVVDEVVRVSKRNAIPIRYDFVQRRRADGSAAPGPLASIVAAADKRALILYLLLLSKASSAPWNAALPSPAWARALDIALPESHTAAATISKIWRRLDQTHKLVERGRKGRSADVHLRHESGDPAAHPTYTNPGIEGDSYFKVSFALWQHGPPHPGEDSGPRWFQVLTLAELAALLIASTFMKPFRLAQERGPRWYGISSDTLGRGLKGLIDHGILTYEDNYRKAPLSRSGWTLDRTYTLAEPFLIHEPPPTKAPAKSLRASKKAAKKAAKTTAPTKKTAAGAKSTAPSKQAGPTKKAAPTKKLAPSKKAAAEPVIKKAAAKVRAK